MFLSYSGTVPVLNQQQRAFLYPRDGGSEAVGITREYTMPYVSRMWENLRAGWTSDVILIVAGSVLLCRAHF